MVGAEMRLFGIHKGSKNKELAADFITLYYSKEAQLAANSGTPSLLPICKIPQEQLYQLNKQARRNLFSIEAWNHYLSVLSITVPRNMFPALESNVERVLKRYYQDEICLTEAISLIEQITNSEAID